jgi:acetoin utilization protein AcuC
MFYAMVSLKRSFEHWTRQVSNLYVAYDDIYLDWQLGNGDGSHPTNPIRAKLAVEFLENLDPVVITPSATESDRDLLNHVHSDEYISKVLDQGHCGEWYPDQPHLGAVALEMAAGTIRLYEKILSGEAQVAFNPQGAKHHAQYDRSSGFCVFNDMALVAKLFMAAGLKPMYIDWDAHHGDGVENILRAYPNLVTASIHQGGIFPGTGLKSEPENGVYNWALRSEDGDVEFLDAMQEIELLADEVQPDVILLATGADAHYSDPLSNLKFDYPGYRAAAQIVGNIANKHAKGRVLIGGAGGYQPLNHTPQVWAQVVSQVYSTVNSEMAV